MGANRQSQARRSEPSSVPRRGIRSSRRGGAGYALLDVVLAVALFAITVTGLLRVFKGINDTSSSFARDRFIQQQIEALLAEKRRVEPEAVPYEAVDPLSGITFRTFLEPLQLDNGEGDTLEDLYLLTAEAVFLDEGGEQVEKAELIVHRPES